MHKKKVLFSEMECSKTSMEKRLQSLKNKVTEIELIILGKLGKSADLRTESKMRPNSWFLLARFEIFGSDSSIEPWIEM